MDHAEFERAHGGGAIDGVFLLLPRERALRLQILHDLPEIDIHQGAALEAQVQPDPEDEIRAVGLQIVVHGVRLVEHLDAHKPVGLGPLGVLVQNGIEDISVDLPVVCSGFQKDQIVGQQRFLLVLVQALQIGDVIGEGQARAVMPLQPATPVPDHHDEQQQESEDHGHIAAVHELAQAGEKEHRLNGTEDQQHQAGEQR